MSKPAFTRAEPDTRRLSLIEATARVLAREGAVQVRIDTLEVMNMSGKLDIREALDWAAENRAMLMAKWEEFSGDGV